MLIYLSLGGKTVLGVSGDLFFCRGAAPPRGTFVELLLQAQFLFCFWHWVAPCGMLP